MPPFGELPLDGVVATFRAAIDRTLGLIPGDREVAATTVTGSEVLAGSGLVVITAAGRHRLVSCDPAVRERLADLADARHTPDPAELSFEAGRRGATAVETVALQVVHRRGLRPAELPAGGAVRRRRTDEVALELDELSLACSDDGSDTEPDHAGPVTATIASGADGVPLAAVTERPAAWTPGFVELRAVVRPSARGLGWGAGSAAAATRACFATGRLPMCRSAIDHGPALRLAARLGYRRVGELWLSRFDAYASTSSSNDPPGAARSA